MKIPTLPAIDFESDLTYRLSQVSSSRDVKAVGEELFFCLLYTDLDKAAAWMSHAVVESAWRMKGLFALHKGALDEAHYYLVEAMNSPAVEMEPMNRIPLLLDMAALEMERLNLSGSEDKLVMAAKLLRQHPNPAYLFRLQVRQGMLALRRGQHPQALKYLIQADGQFHKRSWEIKWEDIHYLTLLYAALGELYDATGEKELSLSAFAKVNQLCHHYGMTSRIHWYSFQEGNACMALERWEEAVQHFERAETLSASRDDKVLGAALANKGYCLFRKGEHAKAKAALASAEALFGESPHDFFNMATLYNWKAQLALALGEEEQVMEFFVRASDLARAIKDNALLADICKQISTFYAGKGDYRNAYEYLSLFVEFGTHATHASQQKHLMEIQVHYETEQAMQEAESLRAQAMELRLQAMRAQMNPHFLFNALNGIQNFIHAEDADKASRYLAKFAGLVRKSLNMSSAELVTLEEEMAFIKDYLFVNQILRFNNRLTYAVSLDEDIEDDRVMIPPMMIQPFVENAIEHGFIKREKGHVAVRVESVDHTRFRCVVEDNGIGREAAIQFRSQEVTRENHQSLGIGITRERLELLNRSGHPGHSIEITDMKDKSGNPLGTKVEIYFPVRTKS